NAGIDGKILRVFAARPAKRRIHVDVVWQQGYQPAQSLIGPQLCIAHCAERKCLVVGQMTGGSHSELSQVVLTLSSIAGLPQRDYDNCTQGKQVGQENKSAHSHPGNAEPTAVDSSFGSVDLPETAQTKCECGYGGQEIQRYCQQAKYEANNRAATEGRHCASFSQGASPAAAIAHQIRADAPLAE